MSLYRHENTLNKMTIEDTLEEPQKKPITPATDETGMVLENWRRLYNELVFTKGMGKWEAMSAIGKLYEVRSASTVNYHLHEDVRLRELERKKNHPKDKKNDYDRAINRATKHVYRNIDFYVSTILENAERPLTKEEITFRIREKLEEDGRPGVLLRDSTLTKWADKYFKDHGKKLYHPIQDGNIEKWSLASQAPGYNLLKK